MASLTSSLAHSQSAQVLAPSGTLRASINLGNPLLAHINPQIGQPAGVSVDLSQAFGCGVGTQGFQCRWQIGASAQ